MLRPVSCIAEAKPYKLRVLHGVAVCVCPCLQHFAAPKLGFCATFGYPIREMWLLICQKSICGLKHGQSAQGTMF